MSEGVRVVVLDGARVVTVGWQRVSVRRQLGTCAGTFSVDVLDLSEGLLRNGNKVGILSQNRPVLIGYVESSEFKLERGERSFTFSGRELTGDLVDSSAPVDLINTIKSKTTLSLKSIAAALAQTQGIEVRFLVPDPLKFDEFALRQDETCWSAIERAARLRKVTVQGDGQGRLEFVQVGMARSPAALVQGVNVISASFRSTVDERFQLYRVVGQRGSDGSRGWGKDNALALAEARDGAIGRPRVLVVVAEDSVDAKTAEERAQWEATVRAARATTLTATVPGWRLDFALAALRGAVNPVAPFWVPNLLVPIELPALGLTEDLLVDAVEHSCDRGGGAKTSLQLVRKDAYQQLTEKAEVYDHAADALEDGE